MVNSDPPDTIVVSVSAYVSGGLSTVSLGEKFSIKAKSLEAALAVLNRFHELAERLRDEQAGVAK